MSRFLWPIYAIRTVSRAIVAAIGEVPDATASAVRKAAKAKE